MFRTLTLPSSATFDHSTQDSARGPRCVQKKGGWIRSSPPSASFPAKLSRRNLVKLASFGLRTLSRGLSIAPPQREIFIPTLMKFLGTCGISPLPRQPMMVTAPNAKEAENNSAGTASSRSTARRINISFAFISATLPLRSDAAAAKAIRRRVGAPISRGTCRRTASERKGAANTKTIPVDRKNLPSSPFVSLSSLSSLSHPLFLRSSLRSPSLFATRYDDHDNKMCGEGGRGAVLP